MASPRRQSDRDRGSEPPAYLDTKYHISARLRAVIACRKYARCNSAICSHCQYRKSRQHLAKMTRILGITHDFNQNVLPSSDKLYRVVLTQKYSESSLPNRIAKLYDDLRAMTHTRNPFRREHIRGGVCRLHVPFTPPTGRWNPHFDCMFECRTLPTSAIREEWQRVTGDSHVVRVDPIRLDDVSFHRLSDYITKVPFAGYAVTDVDSALRNGPLLETYEGATRRRRKIMYFGTWMRLHRPPAKA